MTLKYSIRKLIDSWLRQGKNAPEICQLLRNQCSKATIYRWIKRIAHNKILAKNSPGRPRTVTSKLLIDKIKRNFSKNKKTKSARKIAKENNCSPRTVMRIIKNNLSLKPYKRVLVPALTTAHINKRLSFFHWIKNRYSVTDCRKILFSDEKIFDQDGQLNRQNDRVYAASRSEANLNMGLRPTHKFPFKVMVWIGITYNGVCQLFIVPQKEKMCSTIYCKKVLPIVKRDGLKLIGDDFIFQQDGATCHTSKMTIENIKNMGINVLPPDIWPPNSPDLNPLDYFMWNEIENRIKFKKCENRDDLIKNIKKAVRLIPQKMIQESIDQFRPRLYAVFKNCGGLINNKFN
jgi:hypothetical protein